jgi:hypothetical protein
MLFASVTGRTTTSVTVGIRNPTNTASAASAVQVLGIRL